MKTSRQDLRVVGKPALNLCPYGSDSLRPVRQAWWMLPSCTQPLVVTGAVKIHISIIDRLQLFIDPALLKELSHGRN